MADIFTPKKRSEVMSLIRSKWTKPEIVLHNKLKSMKIRHRMHPDIGGKPDVLLKDFNTLVFIDGCFWHGCKKCCRKPKTNRSYWIPKIEGNVKRDRKNRSALRKMGYSVIRIWEHDLKKTPERIIEKRLKGI